MLFEYNEIPYELLNLGRYINYDEHTNDNKDSHLIKCLIK